MYADEVMDVTGDECSRAGDGFACEGKLVDRVSRSGLTVSTMCEGHMWSLEEKLDDVARRYPEVNHPYGCTCYGCSDGSW